MASEFAGLADSNQRVEKPHRYGNENRFRAALARSIRSNGEELLRSD